LKQSFSAEGGKLIRRVTIAGCERSTAVANVADSGLAPEPAWWQSVLRGRLTDTTASVSRLTIVDAFCGSGGLGLGVSMAAEAAHRKPVFKAIIDTDPEAIAVHRHNLGAERGLAQSVTGLVDYHVQSSRHGARFAYTPEIVSEALSSIDALDMFVAGPPCQGHSNLNNHTRRQDPRNELYLTTIALGVALGARTILIENVPTVQNAYSSVVETSLSLLRSEGYGLSTSTLRADSLGAPQRRSRFFILAVKGLDLPPEFLAEVGAIFQSPAQPVSWAISDLLDRDAETIWDSAPALTPANQRRIDYLFENELFDLPDAQRPDCHKEGTTYTSVYGRMYWDRPSQTITTGIGTPGQGRYIHPLRRRLITPHEAARLQGYPEWFDFAPPGVPLKRKNLAKWIGDAVHPTLGYVAGIAALEAMEVVDQDPSRAA
jgi:DNA (cytosine-5)-methyltransferase 1